MMTPFAVNLRKRAETLKLSNAEVARRVGLSERRYGNYITGRTEPDLATLVRIATVLATSVDSLLSDNEESRPGPKDALTARLLAATAALKKSDLEAIAIQAEALAAARLR